jgi:hypothetical protein
MPAPLVRSALLLALLSSSCNSGEQSRSEARALLDRLNKLKADGSLTERKQALDSLEQFGVHNPEHLRVRDLCRNAHLQLLDAEAAQVGARKALEEATRSQQPGGGSITPERGQAIAAELERSNAALVAARREFPKCQEATLALSREAR